MKNKLLICLSMMLFCISFISAVPQVIFSDINMSIWSNQTIVGNTTVTTGSYSLTSEGLNAVTTFGVNGNCSFSYSRDKIPITFSRDVTQNDTDLATLIHSLAINNNMSRQWQECIVNLSICNNDVGYKGNYSLAKDQLDICYRARDDYSKQVTDLNNKINNLTTWRNLGMIVGIIGAGAAIYLYRKQQVKVLDNRYGGISGVAKQYS